METYRTNYKEELPSNWLDELSSRFSQLFSVDHTVGNKVIVALKKERKPVRTEDEKGDGEKPEVKTEEKPLKTEVKNENTQMDVEKSVPVLDDCIENLKQICKDNVNGIWSDTIFNAYRVIHCQELPPNWRDDLEKRFSDVFSVQRTVGSRAIVSLKTVATQEEEKIIEIPALALPESKRFSVFVTNVTSTTDIHFRLSEFADDLMQLEDQMMSFYSEPSNHKPAKNIRVGQVYVVIKTDICHRVRVTNLDESSEAVSYCCIDSGRTGCCAKDDILIIEQRFLQVPVQNFSCRLANMEIYEKFSRATQWLERNLCYCTVTLEMVDRSENMAMFYDVIDDVNAESDSLNKKLEEYLLSLQLEAPSIPPPSISEYSIWVASVYNDGRVCVQFESEQLDLLNVILSKEYSKFEKLPIPTVVSKGCVYLARYPGDNRLYRATMKDGDESSDSSMVNLCFIDFARVKLVKRENLRDISKLCPMLATIPAQGVQCVLANLPPSGHTWSSKAITKVAQLCYDDENSLTLMSSYDPEEKMPVVHIIRKEGDAYISVNTQLGSEVDLFRSNNLVNRDFIQKNFEDWSDLFILPPKISMGNQDLPTLNEEMLVNVTSAENPFQFSYYLRENEKKLNEMMDSMRSFYEGKDAKIIMESLDVVCGSYYAVNRDSRWIRVRATGAVTDGKVLVHSIDYGNNFTANLSDIQPLYDRFRILNTQAYSAILFGAKPSGDMWSDEECKRFSNLVTNKTFSGIILNIQSENTNNSKNPTILIRLVDKSVPEHGIFIDKVFMGEKKSVNPRKWSIPCESE